MGLGTKNECTGEGQQSGNSHLMFTCQTAGWKSACAGKFLVFLCPYANSAMVPMLQVTAAWFSWDPPDLDKWKLITFVVKVNKLPFKMIQFDTNSKTEFPNRFLKPLILIILKPSPSHCPYPKDERIKSGNLLTKLCSFTLTFPMTSPSHLLFHYSFLSLSVSLFDFKVINARSILGFRRERFAFPTPYYRATCLSLSNSWHN
jgi:hypothetical protein